MGLLGAWKIVPGILAGIVGVVLWLFLAGLAGHHFGNTGFAVVLGLPFVAIFVGGMALWALGYVDSWGNPTDSASRKPRKEPRTTHDPNWEHMAEQARRKELGRLKKDIQDRSWR